VAISLPLSSLRTTSIPDNSTLEMGNTVALPYMFCKTPAGKGLKQHFHETTFKVATSKTFPWV